MHIYTQASRRARTYILGQGFYSQVNVVCCRGAGKWTVAGYMNSFLSSNNNNNSMAETVKYNSGKYSN